MQGSPSQWSFPDMASQLVSFTSAQERAGNHRSYPPYVPQISLPFDKHLTTDHLPPIHHASDGRGIPGTECTRQTMYLPGNTSNLLPLSKAGASTGATVAISPSNGPVVGSTDLRSSPSISTGPCQLTIFYNGSVCVYDHVSPEKAQAIMLLAGNGDPTKPCTSPSSTSKFQPPVSKVAQNDPAIVTQSPVQRLSTVDTAVQNHPPVIRLPLIDPCTANHGRVLHVPSNDIAMANELRSTRFIVKDNSILNQVDQFSGSAPVSASINQSLRVASTSESEVISVISVQANPADPLKVDSSIGAGGVKSIVSAVPQARKASLARFLEKRKERVIDLSPYPVSNAIGVGSTFAATSFVISKKQFDIVESRT